MGRVTDISEGDRLDTLEKEFTRPQLFRYSAIRWNPHRIHYDPEYAKEVEDHPDVLVHGPLHEASMQQLVMDWLGSDGEMIELTCRNIGTSVPETPCFVEAEVVSVDETDGRIELDLWTQQEGEKCAEGTAVVEVD